MEYPRVDIVPLAASRVLQRSGGDLMILLAFGYPAVIRAPSHVRRIGFEVGSRDMTMDTDLSAKKAREILI
jgi:hypothetical protein